MIASLKRMGMAVAIIVPALAFHAAGSSAGEGIGLSVAPAVEFLWGTTNYEIDANALDPSAPDSVSRIRSRLEFPLDMVLVGGDAAYRFGGEERVWSLRAGFRVGVTDPSKLMTDEDWIDNDPVSYTESDAEASLVMVSARVARRIMARGTMDLFAFVGFDYQKIEQDISGFDGWQDLDRNGVRSPVRGDGPVLDYEVTYLGPCVGASMELEPSAALAVDVAASTGLLFASDTDDHIMRGWKGEGDGVGVSVAGSAGVRYYPPLADRWPWVEVSGALRYHWADGNVTKTWYRDSGGVPAGTVDADIPYTFESLQPSLAVALGWGF